MAVQRLIAEGNYGEIDKLSSFGRHMSKTKRLEQLQRNDTLALTELLQEHLEGKVAEGGTSELTKHDKLVVLQRFLTDNNRSPHLRAAISASLNLSTASGPAPANSHRDPPLNIHTVPSSAPSPGSNTLLTERQRRDAAEDAANLANGYAEVGEGRGRQGGAVQGAGVKGAEILSGKNLRKAAAREVRDATMYEREEENQPLAPKVYIHTCIERERARARECARGR